MTLQDSEWDKIMRQKQREHLLRSLFSRETLVIILILGFLWVVPK